jgi:hypothetical protein
MPFSWIAELLPATRDSERRLDLITISQMLNALVWFIENPPNGGVRILDVPTIRKLAQKS